MPLPPAPWHRLGPLVAALAITIASGACARDDSAPSNHDATTATPTLRDSALNLYAATGVNAFAPAARSARQLVYVPNTQSASITIIDPATHQIVRTIPTGAVPQHVVPSHDLTTLWITNDDANTLTPIDPRTGAVGDAVPVDDPYNLYFTPDGRFALVITEDRARFDLRDPKTMKLIDSVPIGCDGANHLDFTADDRYAIASCEFDGQLVKFDLENREIVGYLKLEPGATGALPMPQDVRSSPDGRTFYVVDMTANGIHLIDPIAFERKGFIETGRGAHGIITGREGELFYITNRGWDTMGGGKRGPGSISVLDPKTERIIATWPVPGGGSPDMGNISADGKELWITGRYDSEVYVFDTTTGKLAHRIQVGDEPHGLCLWPQPGRYSLGHTGNMR
jgi:YVTN family beta-propeller protein